MIQRKQSLFLLGAVIAIVACLFFPLIAVEPAAMGSETLVFNLGVRDANGIISFLSWPLFASLSIAAVISLANIFLYRNRRLQMRLCLWAMGFELMEATCACASPHACHWYPSSCSSWPAKA